MTEKILSTVLSNAPSKVFPLEEDGKGKLSSMRKWTVASKWRAVNVANFFDFAIMLKFSKILKNLRWSKDAQ